MRGGEETTRHAGWTLGWLFDRAGVRPLGEIILPDLRLTALTDDSRKVIPGSCFVAVPGTVHDGSRFIRDAVAKGAATVVAGPDAEVPGGVPVVRVSDVRDALAKLAAAYFDLRGPAAPRLRLIGVTGTNGKTTVTWLLRSILEAWGQKAALFGTIEYDLVTERTASPLTTPGSLMLCRSLAAACDAGAAFGVLEVSSHALDQRRCEGLTFGAGVFTNLTGDHLDYHKTMEAYLAAKRRLFEMLPRDGVAVVNLDDPRGAAFAEASTAPVVSYGIDVPGVDVRARISAMDRFGTRLVVRTRSEELPIGVSLIGRHNVLNVLAAAATAEAIGVPSAVIRAGLERVSGVPGRLQRVEPDDWPFSVIVDYAHTDDALHNVLTALRALTRGRLICVFGCGGDRDRSKRARMAAVVEELADLAYVTSDNPRTEDPAAIIGQILKGFSGAGGCGVEVQADRRLAIGAAIANARPGDTILVAGKGHEDYQIVGTRTLHFDDVEVAKEYLAAATVREVVA